MSVGFPAPRPSFGFDEAGPRYEGPVVGRRGKEPTWRMPDSEHPAKGDGVIVDGRPRPDPPSRVGIQFEGPGGVPGPRIHFDPSRATTEQQEAARDAAMREVLGRVVASQQIPKDASAAVAWAYVKHLEAEMSRTQQQYGGPTADPSESWGGAQQPQAFGPPQPGWPQQQPPQAFGPPQPGWPQPPAFGPQAVPPFGPPAAHPFGPPAARHFGPPAGPGFGAAPPRQAGALPWAASPAKFAAAPPPAEAPAASRRVRFWIPTAGRPVAIPARYHAIDVQQDAAGAPLAFYLQWDARDGDEPYPLDSIEGPFAIETDAEPGVYHSVENPALACRCGDYLISILLAVPPTAA